MPTVTRKFVIAATEENKLDIINAFLACHNHLGWRDGFCLFPSGQSDEIDKVIRVNGWIGFFYNASLWRRYNKNSGAIWDTTNDFFLRRSFKIVDIKQLKKSLQLIAKSEGRNISLFNENLNVNF